MSDRILRNTQPNLEVTFYSGDDPVDADGAVTVDITRADGTLLVDDGGTTHPGTGRYRYVLAPQADLDHLTVVWTGAFGGITQKITTHVQIVGGFYVALAEVRGLSGMDDQTSYPDSQLVEARRWFEDLAEGELVCDVAFVPRYGRELFDGENAPEILLRQTHRLRKLLAVKVDGASKTLSEFVPYPEGRVYWKNGSFPAGYRNVEIAYEHGHDGPDEGLRQAALVAIKSRVLGDRSGIPVHALTMSTDVGSFTLAMAGGKRHTGIPFVDAALEEHQERAPLVG